MLCTHIKENTFDLSRPRLSHRERRCVWPHSALGYWAIWILQGPSCLVRFWHIYNNRPCRLFPEYFKARALHVIYIRISLLSSSAIIRSRCNIICLPAKDDVSKGYMRAETSFNGLIPYTREGVLPKYLDILYARIRANHHFVEFFQDSCSISMIINIIGAGRIVRYYKQLKFWYSFNCYWLR